MAEKTPDTIPTTLITTHLNADFDAVASAVAAARLYGPGSAIVLPGSQEKAVRNFLRKIKEEGSSISSLFVQLKQIDLSKLKRIVVVDTNQMDRLGQIGELIHQPSVEVVVFDHHKKEECDIPFRKYVSGSCGANTTLLLRRLRRKKGLELPEDEIVLYLLGIYEDTGSFTFSSTTADDLRQAAWLVEKGGNLKKVSEFLASRFTPEHISALYDMLESAQTLNFGNIPITVAKASSAMYIDDFAILAHELMDMAHLPVLFTLAMMGDHVIVVARSRDKRVDVGKILQKLGGGGHPFAASASLKGMTLSEAENALVSEIASQIGKGPKVRDIMSSPVVWVEPNTPIYEVHDLIAKYGFSVIPVAVKGKIKGYVTRNIIEKAIYHGLGREPVSEYMATEFKTLAPDDDIGKVQQTIVEGHQRFIPVVKEGLLVGIITRTDLLEVLSSDPQKRPESLIPPAASRRNIRRLMKMQLPDKVLELLEKAGQVADELGMNVYVVGGFVRDLLLRKPNFDIDLVVEGDGIRFAKHLAKKYKARVRSHKKFGTAVIIFPDGSKIDVATARWEYYEYPAAMPTVAISSIKLDLFRRDFTINTLAIKLNPKDFGMLIDFFGGQRDLKDGIIRVLHSLSFIDDPTRILRAVRFEQRFGFKIGKHTLRLIKNSLRLGILDRLSSKRLFTELRLILEEPDPRPCLKRLEELGVLLAINPALGLDDAAKGLLDAVYDVLAWYQLLYMKKKIKKWQVYLMAFFSGMPKEAREKVANRLGITGKMAEMMIGAPELAKRIIHEIEETVPLKNSRLVKMLEGLEMEFVLFTMAMSSEKARQAISRFITDFSKIKPHVTGRDLKKLGFTPGPIYRKVLDFVKNACLDGLVASKDEEVELIKKEFGDHLK